MRITTLAFIAVAGAFAGCGGGDDEPSGPEPKTKMAALVGGDSWGGGELRTCLEGGGLAVKVELAGPKIDAHDGANNYIVVDNGAGEILLFSGEQRRDASEEKYRASFTDDSEVGKVHNALWRTAATMDPQKAADLKGCLGVG